MSTILARHLLKTLPLPILLLSSNNQDFNIIEISDAYTKICGLKAVDLIGKSVYEIFSMDATMIAELKQSLQEAIKYKVPHKITGKQYDFQENDSATQNKYWEIEHAPVFDDKGEIISIMHSVIDVTEQFILNQQLAEANIIIDKRNELLRKAETISKFGTWELDLVTNDLQWSDGVFSICGYEPQAFEVTLEKGLGIIHPDDRGMAIEEMQLTMQSGKEYRIEKRFLLEDNTIKHIISRGSIIKDVAGNPLKLFGVFQDITDEKIQQIALQKAKDELNKIMDSSLDIICTIDGDGNFVQISAACFKIWGYKPEELIGTNFMNLVHEDDRDVTNQSGIDIKSGIETTNFENRYVRKDGSIVPMVWSSRWDAVENIHYCVAKDATEKKASEAALVESAKQYKYLFDNNPSPMFIWDFKTLKIVECNEEALLKYGYTREEMLSLTILDVRPESEKPLLYAATQKEETYGKIHKRIWIHKTKNNELLKVEVIGHLMDYNGRRVSFVQINDVTEKEGVLQELKDSEIKLRTATNIAKLGYWQVNIEQQHLYWSDEVYTLWGVSKNSFDLNFESFVNTIHPDDIAMFLQKQREALNEIKVVDIAYRIILPDGQIKWIHEIGKPIKDDTGKIISFEGTVQDISEQKNAQRALVESNERYKFVSKATSDAIWDWDLRDQTIYWGEGYLNIFGHTYEQLSSIANSWIKNIHPDDVTRVTKGIKIVIENNNNINNWEDEYRYRRADGSYAYVMDKGFTIRDTDGKAIRMVGAMRDITLQKEKEQQLKLLESVVVNTKDAVMITEAEPFDFPGPRIIYVNEAFTKMTGYTAEEVIGKSPRILQGPESDKNELSRLGKSLREWETAEITIINYKKNGEKFWINFTVIPVADETGWFTHWIAIERDVTEIKIAEEAQKQLKQLELSLEKEKEINSLKTRFTALASHEFRTPIATIVSGIDILGIYVDMMQDEKLKEKIKLHLNKIVSQSNRLTEMLRDILLLEKTAVNTKEYNLELIDIVQLINDINQQYYSDRNDNRTLEIHLPEEHKQILSNTSFLNHIISNLVNNAFKYSSGSKNPSLTLLFHPDCYHIVVTDYGLGIPLGDQEHLFELFYRANNVLHIEGTGLGLTITKEFTNKLGGQISFVSQEGIGTTFTLKFPYEALSITPRLN